MELARCARLSVSNTNHESRTTNSQFPFLILRRPIVWYNLHVKMILATVAMMSMCGSVVFAGPVAVHSNLPPDTEFETNIVAEAWSEFDRVLDVRVALPAIKKFDVAVLAVLLAVCTVVAQKGTNDPPRGASAPYSEDAPGNGGDAIATSNGVSRCGDGVSPSRSGIGNAVTAEDVARMFAVMSVGTNEVFDFTMPADATRVQKWWLRGGSNDRAFVPGGVVKIGGELLDSLRNPTNRFYPLKATSLLVAQESEFWHLGTASNSTVYTWKDAYLWRSLSLPFSMQAEIFDDGDFEYRYDLSRISDMDVFTNVVIGAKFGTNELGDVAVESGLAVPAIHVSSHTWPLPDTQYPPVANEWGSGSAAIPGWTFLGSNICPEPGFIAGRPSPRGIGHCGIVDYDGWTISARQNGVSRNADKMLDGSCGYNKPEVTNGNAGNN